MASSRLNTLNHKKLVSRTTTADIGYTSDTSQRHVHRGERGPLEAFAKDGAIAEMTSFQEALGAPALSNFFKVSMDLASEGAQPIRQFPGDSGGLSSDTEARGLNQWLTSAGVLSGDDKVRYELLANEAMLPGTQMSVAQEIGSRQGIKESFATQRNYTDISISFYVSSDYKILRLFQEWMNFMNPIYHSHDGVPYSQASPYGYPNNDDSFAYHRFRYPAEYKKNISITKFERDMGTGSKKGGRRNLGDGQEYTPDAITYNFVNAFPTSIQDIPLNYQAGQVIQVTVEFTYDRYYIVNTGEPKPQNSQQVRNSRLSSPNGSSTWFDQAASYSDHA